MANPKRRTSRARRGNRRAGKKRTVQQLVACTNCGASIIPHHICPSCGFYRGKQMVVVKSA